MLKELIFGSPSYLVDQFGIKIILGPITDLTEGYTASITEHAIETGGTITDHIHCQPEEISFTTFLAENNDIMKSAANWVTGGDKNVDEKVKQLKTWLDQGTILNFKGPLFSNLLYQNYDQFFEDVVISDLKIARNDSTGSGLLVSITLKRVIIAKLQTISIATPKSLKKTTNKGQSQAQKSVVDGNKVKKSLLKSGVSFIQGG